MSRVSVYRERKKMKKRKQEEVLRGGLVDHDMKEGGMMWNRDKAANEAI